MATSTSAASQLISAVAERDSANLLSHACSISFPRRTFFLDLFAGASAPVCTAVAFCRGNREGPIDKLNGDRRDILRDEVFEALLRLASSGLVGAALAVLQ